MNWCCKCFEGWSFTLRTLWREACWLFFWALVVLLCTFCLNFLFTAQEALKWVPNILLLIWQLKTFSTLFWSIYLHCKQIFKLMGPKRKSRKFLATYHKSIKPLFSMLNIGNIPSIAIVTEWDRSIEYIVKLSTFTSCNDFCDFSVKKFPSNQSDVNIYSFRNPTPPRLTQLVCVWIFVYKSEIHSRTICWCCNT